MPGASDARRAELVAILRAAPEPVTGSDLSARLGVSRQAVVNDVAILRASGEEIVGSPQGYFVGKRDPGRFEPNALVACVHDDVGARREMEILVDHGISVLDVVVEHPVYGEVRGNMMIASRADVERYMALFQEGSVPALSSLTDGVHLHGVHAPSPDALEAAKRALRTEGILLED